ncbi:hypothetical protein [Devosia sp.]|uniref:hypothetical protein n=1 Tax=Devosia sp. TaxID=1871048 RepID=UPI001B2304A0|nr:hypothetical protein [Devosia sp.]MBO9587547.1 hypothetical protein [Devosia sp.]
MSNRSGDRGISRSLVIIVIIAVVAVIGYVVISQSGGSGPVPDRTNDETETVPS